MFSKDDWLLWETLKPWTWNPQLALALVRHRTLSVTCEWNRSLFGLSSGYGRNSSRILGLSQASLLPFLAERTKLVVSDEQINQRREGGKGKRLHKPISPWDNIRVKQTSHKIVVALTEQLEEAQMSVSLQNNCKIVPGLFGECMLLKSQSYVM